MRKLFVVLLLLGALLATTGLVAAERLQAAGKPTKVGKPDRRNFVVHMTPEQEVQEPKVESDAKGVGVFHLSKDGAELRWMLVATNIEHVTMAHIHINAKKDQNSSTLVTLFNKTIEGETNGLLMRGTIKQGDTPLFAEMVAALRAGEAYVNVHTVKYPAGELRGQFGSKDGQGHGERHGGGSDTDGEKSPKKKAGKGHGHGRGHGQGGGD